MLGLFRSLSLSGRIGVVGALLGFAAGMAAVIAVDPIAGVVIVAACVALLAFCIWFFFGPEIRRQRLLTRGVPAEAEILAVEETGITVQGNYPVGRFRFLVYPPEDEPYEATAKCTLNRFEIPAYQPGSTVHVLIDPKDHRKVTLA